jgi:carboxypeptidase family protein
VARRWFSRSSGQLVHATSADSTRSTRGTNDLMPDDATGPAVHRLMTHLASAPSQPVGAIAAGVDTRPGGESEGRLRPVEANPAAASADLDPESAGSAGAEPAAGSPVPPPDGSSTGPYLIVTGGVRTEAGQPRAGATITVINPVGDEVARSSADDNGNFEVRGLPGGAYTILAISLPYRPNAALIAGSAGQTSVDLILQGRGTVTGRLATSASGSPLAGTEVRLVQQENDSVSMNTSSDDSGRFRFDEVPEGPWSIGAQCPGHRSARMELDVTAGSEIDRELILTPFGHLRGQVVLANSIPVAGVRLSLVNSEGQLVAATTTDDNGSYHFADLEPASYVVVCLTVDPEPDLLSVASGQTVDYSVRVAAVPTP